MHIKKQFTTTTSKTEVLEIQIPSFRKYGSWLWKFDNHNTVAMITDNNSLNDNLILNIEVVEFINFHADVYLTGKPATAADWNTALLALNIQVNNFCAGNLATV